MSWSAMSTRAFHGEHRSTTHKRWCKRNLSEGYKRRAHENEIWHRRKSALMAAGMPEREAIEQTDREAALFRLREEDEEAYLQCGGCSFYACLEWPLGADWGACTNPASPHDGTLMFEHDHCSHYTAEEPPANWEYLWTNRHDLKVSLLDHIAEGDMAVDESGVRFLLEFHPERFGVRWARALSEAEIRIANDRKQPLPEGWRLTVKADDGQWVDVSARGDEKR